MTQPSQRIRVLTLNLHCWQEHDAEAKLVRIAETIAELEPDVVMLQEVGQHVDAPIVGTRNEETIRADNAALLIVQTLQQTYALRYEWRWALAHIGFDVWEEGVAMLGRLPFAASEAWFVSSTHHAWNARRMLVAEVQLADRRYVTCASVHFSWWADEAEPFAQQWDRANAIVSRRMEDGLVAGDFNVRDDGPGYEYVMREKRWTDAHAEAVAPAAPQGTFPGDIAGWSGSAAGRIDYVLHRGPHLLPVAARTLFDTEATRVSDHFGLLVDLQWIDEAEQ